VFKERIIYHFGCVLLFCGRYIYVLLCLSKMKAFDQWRSLKSPLLLSVFLLLRISWAGDSERRTRAVPVCAQFTYFKSKDCSVVLS
jgi:hypothetical protein